MQIVAAAMVGGLDIVVFLVLAVAIIGFGLWSSRGERLKSDKGAQDYFLAGRGLTWWLVGFSLIAANISTEQFVGMSGKAADWLGMAIASYEWMAAITLIFVAFVFLPTFLKSGIYTIPEFLEYRYNKFARTVMAIATLVILVGVPTASVIFSGAKVITGNFQGVTLMGLDFGSITVGCWIIGSLAAIYVFAGGLKACAWTDLLWGSGLIIGGAIIAWFAFRKIGAADPSELIATATNSNVTIDSLKDAGPFSRFWQLSAGALPDGKLHMVRPADDPEIPWTALVVGLWIPNFFYWGLNQYITQRTLGSKSLAEGQKGVVFAAFLKIIIPFVVVIPGIMAYNLFSANLKEDAVNRNAQVVSLHSPELYASFSEELKPQDVERNKTVLASIQKNLDNPKADPKPYVYKLDDKFAAMYPEDTVTIVSHNVKTITPAEVEKLFASAAEKEKFDAEKLAQFSAIAKSIEMGKDLEIDPDTLLAFSNELTSMPIIKAETLPAHDFDNAFPTLIRKLLPTGIGLKGFVLVAIFGAVVSSLASMLNSASTIATMDIYNKLRHNASQYELVTTGRVFVIVFVLIAMVIAPMLANPELGGIFTYIQEFQGFISPGILAIFLFGLLIHRAPRFAGTVGLLLNPILYGLFKFSPDIFGHATPEFLVTLSKLSFLDRMAVCFGIVIAVLTLLTIFFPLKKPVELPVNEEMDVTPSKGAMAMGGVVIVLTVAMYIIFW